LGHHNIFVGAIIGSSSPELKESYPF